tara:strand:- start:263 stop:1216 length:954 start_codon:yes stop_codon:yes gene_type:complete
MKVHTLDIDSSERDITAYPYANNYTIRLENPIYDVSEISLISARIPTPQLTTCTTNKSFSVDGNVYTLDETNYANGSLLATDIDTKLQGSSVDTVVFDADTNKLTLSNSAGTHEFTLGFRTGVNGYTSNNTPLTTPHQILGFGSNDYISSGNSLTSGSINLSGPNSLILKLSAGSEEFTKTVYSSSPFYTGHILLNGGDFVNVHGSDDPIVHNFHKGSQKHIQDIKLEFFYTSHGRLIPYDFMNQDHIIKLNIKCSTDKLENLTKIENDAPEEIKVEPTVKTNIGISGFGNLYEWKEYIYILIIVFVGVLVLTSMKR